MSVQEPQSFTTPDQATAEWLPAWFVPRMMEGNGGLALYLVTGVVVPIDRIDRVHQAADGSVWLDVVLSLPGDGFDGRRMALPATNPEASLNAAHVVAAIETGRFDPESVWDVGVLRVESSFRP
jgi:hypothetical protein